MDVVYKAVAARVGHDFVMSDETVDRMGDIINVNGWDLSTFKDNPIALWDHGKDPEIGRKPIGRWEDVRVKDGKLIGRFVPATGVMQRIDELLKLIELGFLKAVSVGFYPKAAEPLDRKNPSRGIRYLSQQLLECSVVAVGANPAALAVAKSLNISDDTLAVVFGENALGDSGMVRRGLDGAHAGNHPPTHSRKANPMKTFSDRVKDAEDAVVAARDAYAEHVAVEDFDIETAKALKAEVERRVARAESLQEAEKALGVNAGAAQKTAAPAINRRPLGFPQDEVKAADLIFRKALVHFDAHVNNQNIDQVLERRYPGHEATFAVTKADATVATTTTSGWASQLVNTATTGFLDLLTPFSIYPGLSARGVKVTFDNSQGAITIPTASTNAALAGGFVLEGDPIPVGRMTFSSVSLTPHKFGIITTLTKEAAKYTTPALEGVLRSEILNRTAITLDGLLLDATAGSTTRPAGLLNGVSAAASGYGGGDYEAVINDINTVMAPFDTANAGRSMVLIMHPAQARKLAMMPGPDGTFGWAERFMSQFTVLVSTTATANRLIAVDAADFATASGDVPTFDVSEQATIHMSDTPLEIVSGTGPTPADPVRSLWQTNSIGIRMLLPLTWKMRRSGMVQWIDGTTW